ncbi:uncharacterized protein LOC119893354 isoform X2 [Micropterus salmoides]|uniref:uncharacterized protein LOC119893354 isoform X2 n=1 Tax=Micropterus salmoides TaxID=27706 RepID=UPI0018ECD674|nr:uncharacterized protein LOC119893354 isoform X2 [Micropterus salmoides]
MDPAPSPLSSDSSEFESWLWDFFKLKELWKGAINDGLKEAFRTRAQQLLWAEPRLRDFVPPWDASFLHTLAPPPHQGAPERVPASVCVWAVTSACAQRLLDRTGDGPGGHWPFPRGSVPGEDLHGQSPQDLRAEDWHERLNTLACFEKALDQQLRLLCAPGMAELLWDVGRLKESLLLALNSPSAPHAGPPACPAIPTCWRS